MSVRFLPLVLVLTLGGLLSGCGGNDGGSTTAGPAAPQPNSAGSELTSTRAADAAKSGGSVHSSGAVQPNGGGQVDVAAAVARRVRTAQLTVEVNDLPGAATRVRAAAVSLGGIVSAESSDFLSGTDPQQRQPMGAAPKRGGESVITVRVPEPRLDDALTRMGSVGREIDRSTSSEDVTATIADLDSRVSTQARSVARVRDLLNRAKSLQDVVLLESEVARREADLESIQARQRALADQADLATVTVTLQTPPPATAKPPTKDDEGFLVGLRQGWHAVLNSTTLVLTVLGALLPVTVALALLGWPSYLLYRRLRPTPIP